MLQVLEIAQLEGVHFVFESPITELNRIQIFATKRVNQTWDFDAQINGEWITIQNNKTNLFSSFVVPCRVPCRVVANAVGMEMFMVPFDGHSHNVMLPVKISEDEFYFSDYPATTNVGFDDGTAIISVGQTKTLHLDRLLAFDRDVRIGPFTLDNSKHQSSQS